MLGKDTQSLPREVYNIYLFLPQELLSWEAMNVEVKASAPEGKEKGKEKMGLRAGGKLKGILSTEVAESEDERTGTRKKGCSPSHHDYGR